MKCPHCGKVFDQPSVDNALETYYRRKAAGARRVTLKVIAEETGFSAAYLKNAKRQYDAAGKWGSKKAKP